MDVPWIVGCRVHLYLLQAYNTLLTADQPPVVHLLLPCTLILLLVGYGNPRYGRKPIRTGESIKNIFRCYATPLASLAALGLWETYDSMKTFHALAAPLTT